MLIQNKFRLSRTQTILKLAEIEKTVEVASTIYLPAGISLTDTETLLKQIPATEAALSEILRTTAGAATGAVIFWGKTQKLVIRPAFMVKEKLITTGYDVEVLLEILKKKLTIGMILVRLGYYAIGIAQDEELLEHKTGTGLVHGRQRQGGSSANRFRQRRVEQTHHFLERVVTHTREMFEPHARTLDYVVYGGARTTITELCKHSIFFKQFEARLLPSLLDITNPHYDVLQKAVTDVWSSRVTAWEETNN